jgi:holo-[acyl-carrier protein] synthase
MEIVGVGIDIVEVGRIKSAVGEKKNFLKRIFSEREIKLSERGKFRFEELAGRFAVKEAVFKALKTGWRRGVAFKDITVLNEPSGAPYVELHGKTQEYASSMGVKNVFVSVSHTKSLAVAIVLLTK